MKNTVRVSATFSFKGETYSPGITLDLDEFLSQDRRLEDIYSLLAKQGEFGHYSYEYEMLLAAPLVFEQPTVLAEGFVQDGQLDLEGLRAAWQQAKLLDRLTAIAQQHMGVDDLDAVPGLKGTLLATWQAAKP